MVRKLKNLIIIQKDFSYFYSYSVINSSAYQIIFDFACHNLNSGCRNLKKNNQIINYLTIFSSKKNIT